MVDLFVTWGVNQFWNPLKKQFWQLEVLSQLILGQVRRVAHLKQSLVDLGKVGHREFFKECYVFLAVGIELHHLDSFAISVLT